jgi:macrolide-specific efflux system membrane fusion protein
MVKIFIKRKFIVILCSLAVVVGLGAGVLLNRPTAPAVSYRFGEVTRGTVAVAVSASGNARTDQQADVSAQISGTVSVVHIKQGDSVTEGQPLYEVRNDDIDAEVAAAYASYLDAQQSVEQARASLSEAEAARDTVHGDPASNESQKNAASQEVVAAQTGIAAANQSKSAAWLRYDNLRQQTSRRIVRAPMNGTVTNVAVKVGDQAGSGTRAAASAPTASGSRTSGNSSTPASTADVVIQNGGSLKAFVSVNEADIAQVKPGQKATVTFDAFEDLRATGTVERVDAVGTNNQGVITYQAVITLDTVDPRLRPEMTLSADITTEAKDNILHVPITAVKTRANGQKYVETMDSNVLKTVDVQTGLASDTMIEIVSGLNEGARIITQTIQATSISATSSSQKSDSASTGLSDNGPKGQ